MKKVIISGGTGLVGKELAKLLKSNNYHITNISRDIGKSKKVLPIADEHLNYYDNKNWKEYFENSFAVVNLAGASIAGRLWTKKYKNLIYKSRIESTKKITNTIRQLLHPPKVIVNASAVGYYKNQNSKIITEESEKGNDFLAKVCIDWEFEALKVKNRTRVVLARTGIVLDKKEGALAKMLLPYHFFLGGPLGSGHQFMPWIHIKDIAELYKWVIENDKINGAVNFCSSNPISMNEFAITIGKILHRPSVFRVPATILKLLLGEMSDILLKGQKAIPKKAIENGFQFKFNNIYDALKDLLTDKQ